MSGEGAARLNVDGKEVALPLVEGTDGGGALDVSELRAETGLVTFDPGYGNTAETRSSITLLDGEAGVLRYRGYPIDQLAEQSSFLEVAFLLAYGDLPTPDGLAEWEDSITRHTMLREDMKYLFEAFPHDAHPMQVLASAVSALATYYPDALDPHDEEALDLSARRLLAKSITMSAWAYKYSVHQPYVYPRNDVDYTTNFLAMMFSIPPVDTKIDPTIAKALDLLFVLHADHEQNCSASTVRLVGSGGANLFSAVSAGIQALSGPLHGGANQEVVEMLQEMHEGGGDISPFVARAKDRSDPYRLMGFGHRVYKNFDPRATIIKKTALEVLDQLDVDDPLLDLAMELEQVALTDDYFVERKLYPNVDFYSGIIYRALGFPIEMFPVLFAIGRMPGWIAQFRESAADPHTRIGRPRQVYTGVVERDYVPLSER